MVIFVINRQTDTQLLDVGNVIDVHFGHKFTKGSPIKFANEGIWALPVGGGSKPLPGWFGALFQRRIFQVQMGISLILGGSKPLPGWFGALF